MTATVTIRRASKAEAVLVASMIDMAFDGYLHLLWSDNPEGLDAYDWGAKYLADDSDDFSCRNAYIAEINEIPAGILLGYLQPAHFTADFGADWPVHMVPMRELEMLAPGSWFVDALAVTPDHRGRGIGADLLRRADQLAAKSGAAELSLIVAEENAGACALYQRHGYRPKARRAIVTFPGTPYGGDWVLMEKPAAA